jgi:DNA-directed RNA polymerase
VTDRLKELSAQNIPYSELWLKYGIKRSTVKRTCMTIVYGSTRYSCTDFVVEDLTKRKDAGEKHPFGGDIFKPASFLSGIIWDSIGEKLNSARVGMDFLQKIARVVSKEQLPIHWITPVGFPIYQSYPEMKSKRVKAMLMGQVIKPRINSETEKTDKLRMSNGVAPNFVHGLDAAAMLRTVNIAYDKGIRNFCNVHDSYGTTAGDVDTLNESLREAFVEIFGDTNVLKDFKDHVAVMLPEDLRKELPEVPTQGELDVEEIRDSEFFFA